MILSWISYYATFLDTTWSPLAKYIAHILVLWGRSILQYIFDPHYEKTAFHYTIYRQLLHKTVTKLFSMPIWSHHCFLHFYSGSQSNLVKRRLRDLRLSNQATSLNSYNLTFLFQIYHLSKLFQSKLNLGYNSSNMEFPLFCQNYFDLSIYHYYLSKKNMNLKLELTL